MQWVRTPATHTVCEQNPLAACSSLPSLPSWQLSPAEPSEHMQRSGSAAFTIGINQSHRDQ